VNTIYFYKASRATAILAVVLALAACEGAEQRAHQHLERGRAFFHAGNYEKARLEFQNTLKIDPNSVEAIYLAGQTMEQLKNIREAVASYRRVLELDKNHNDARVRLGQIFLLAGANEEARKLIDEGLALTPDYAGLLVLRGELRARTGDTVGALQDGQAAIRLDPDNVEAVALLASIYRSQGRTDDAIVVLETGIARHPDYVPMRIVLAAIYAERGEYPKTEQLLKEAVGIEPGNFGLRARLAAFYAARHQPDQAEAVLREGVAHDPSSLGPKLALIEFLYKARDPHAAEDALRQFLAEDPQSLPLRTALAGLYEDAHRLDDAEKVYHEIIAKDAKGANGIEARGKLAGLYWRAGRTVDAEREVAAVLAANPRDNAALFLRAEIALNKQAPADAITALRMVIKDQPDSVAAMRLLARAHLMNDEPQLAREQLQQAVSIAPQDLSLRLQFAQLLARMGEPAEAQKHLGQILKSDSRNPEALENLARVQVALQDYASAHVSAQRLREAYPDNAIGYFLDGEVYRAEKNPAAAVKSYERAIEKADRGNLLPLAALVSAYLEQHHADKALAALNRALQASQNNPALHNLRGEVLMFGLKKTRDAEMEFQKVIEIKSDYLIAYRNLAAARVTLNDREGAIEAYRKGMAANPGNVLLATQLAALYEGLGRYNDAIKIYEELHQKTPDAASITNNLAMMIATYRSDRSSLDQAEKLAGRLADSDNADYLDTRGWVSYRRGDLNTAISLLEQAATKMPNDPVVLYHLGKAYHDRGNRDLARRSLEKALERAQPFAGQEDARALLASLSTS
jgi:tetratricopeptide (TPR) repeat protein